MSKGRLGGEAHSAVSVSVAARYCWRLARPWLFVELAPSYIHSHFASCLQPVNGSVTIAQDVANGTNQMQQHISSSIADGSPAILVAPLPPERRHVQQVGSALRPAVLLRK